MLYFVLFFYRWKIRFKQNNAGGRFLFNGETVTVDGNLHSSKHNQSFSVQDAKLKVYKESKDSDRLKLTINEQNILDWFKQKSQELKRAVNYYKRSSVKPKEGKSKGFKM